MPSREFPTVEVLGVLTTPPPPIFIPPEPPPPPIPLIDSTWHWRLLSSTDNPIRRINSAMCSDGAGKVYLFGGTVQPVIPGGTSVSNDFWVLDRATDQWTQIITAISPPVRQTHRITYMDGKIYLIGGVNFVGLLDDMWVYDIAVGTWTDISTATKIFFTTYDFIAGYPKGSPADSGILFAQVAPNTLRASVPAFTDVGGDKYNTLWEWTVASGNWTQIAITTEVEATLDRFTGGCWIGNKFVVIGGTYFFGNTQKFVHHLTGADWSMPVTPLLSPFQRRQYSEAIWTGLQVFFYGGNDFPTGGGPNAGIGDQWIYYPSDLSFDNLSGIVASPGIRAEHSLSWDGERVVMFGGWRNVGSGNFLGDTWVLENTI